MTGLPEIIAMPARRAASTSLVNGLYLRREPRPAHENELNAFVWWISATLPE